VKARRPSEVIIGKVGGDIHDIGKNLVVFMLDVNGFEVIDLGIECRCRNSWNFRCIGNGENS